MSLMGNRGTFTRSFKHLLMDFELVYHIIYLLLCVLGLCFHEFFYSLLVRFFIHFIIALTSLRPEIAI